MLKVIQVELSSDNFQKFIDLPWDIYGPDVIWNPPLKASLHAELSPQNLFFTHGEVALFICEKDGKSVGRISASIDSLLKDKTVGYFGYFECIDDKEVAETLLNKASEWLRAKGRSTMEGPVNLSIFHAYRVMVQGFELKPFMGEPRNPKYYAPLLESLGCRVKTKWTSWDFDRTVATRTSEKTGKRIEQLKEELSDFTFVPFDLQDFDTELRNMHKISLTSFANNYGMTQISWDEYHQHYASTEKFIFQPGSSLAKNAAGEIVGFYYTLIDPAPAFMAANGDHTRLDWSLVQKDPLWVISSVGLSDKTRGKGLLEKLGNISMNSFLAAGLKHGVASLIKEGPSIFSDLTNQSREYVVYSKPI